MPPKPSDAPVGRVRGPEGSPRDRRRRGSANRLNRSFSSAERPVPPVASRRGKEKERRSGSIDSAPQSLDAPPGRRDEALESLLVDLGSQIQKASAHTSAETLRWQPTGIRPLDRLLGGGFPTGRLSEICGPTEPTPSAGRTAVAQSLVAEALGRGVLAAWIDLADAFDTDSAREAIRARGGEDTDLDRLLWVRARDEDEALRCGERVMRTEGFELVVFDFFRPEFRPEFHSQRGRSFKDVTWLRLARLAAGTRTTLVGLAEMPSTGSRAELVLEMRPRRVAWSDPPHLLESIESEAVLRRHRSRPTGEKVALRIGLDASPPIASSAPPGEC